MTIHEPTVDHQIGARGRLVVRQASGEVTVRGVEGDRVRVEADDAKQFKDRYTVEADDGSLEIRQAEKLGFGIFGRGESVDLEIEVPHGANVTIETQSGDIEASDLDGAKAFRTASGEVVLQRLSGALEVETVSGDLEIEGPAPLDLKGRTVSGDVELRVPLLRRLDFNTTSGDMQLDAELKGDGPFALKTISGDVQIVGRSGIRIEAETITGDLSSDLPSKRESQLGRRVLVVGRPGPTLSFRSVSGDLHVAEPRDAAPKLKETAMHENEGGSTTATESESGTAGDPDAKRLEILRQLERGEISVAEAGDRLGELDGALR